MPAAFATFSAALAGAAAAPAPAVAGLAPTFLRLAETVSRTLASPAFHAWSRFSRSSQCSRSKARAVARVTCRVCAVCESLPVRRPARMAVREARQLTRFVWRMDGQENVLSMTQDSTWEGSICSADAITE